MDAPTEPGRLADADRREWFERDVVPRIGSLYPAALRLTRDTADAEDLLQETLTRAYIGLHQFTPGTNLTAWLRRILTNTFLSSVRKRGREPATVSGLDFRHERLVGGPLAPTARSAEAEVLDSLSAPAVLSALRALPREYQVAIYLADVEGYRYHEVAAIMGTPVGTVMSRLHRGRSRLRAALTPSPVPGDRYPPERRSLDPTTAS